MCFSPISIKSPTAKDNSERLTVPCGRCYACRMNLRISWTFRLNKELLYSGVDEQGKPKPTDSAYFVTLTYNDENLLQKVDKETGEICNILSKADIQTFIKNLRYYSKFRYFAVAEYGESQTKRPHYHLLIFNLTKKGRDKIHDVWKRGNVHIGTVTTASIHYVTKDMMKPNTKKSRAGVKGFRLMSTKPAIGSSFLKHAMNNKLNKDFKVFMNGFKMAMPRYYRDKVFNYKEKEEHAESMIKEADYQFKKYSEDCKRRGIKNPFTYMQKEQEAKQRLEDKLLKNRRL